MSKKLLSFLILLLILVISLFLLPQLASTRVGKHMLIKMAEQKFGGDLAIQSLKLTWFGPQTIDGLYFSNQEADLAFDHIQGDLRLWDLLSLANLHFKAIGKVDGNFLIKNGQIHVHAKQVPESLIEHLYATMVIEKGKKEFKIDAEGAIRGDKMTRTGHFHITGETSSFSLDGSSDFHLQMQNFPPYLFDFFFPSSPLFQKLLGDEANLDLAISLKEGKGPLSLTLYSSLMNLVLDGELNNGLLSLNKDLLLNFSLSPEISSHLLKNISPFFLTGVRSLQPIHLTIKKEGFSCPLPYRSIEGIRIKEGVIDMGKIICKNGQALSLAISLMKSRLSSVSLMEVWFSPLSFSLEKGVLEAGRLDFLVANDFHLCSWGSLNLKTDEVFMTLGITEEALRKAFSLSFLPKNYILTLPIRGKTDHPTINVGEGALKIGMLLATKKGESLFKENIPPPRTPFPWNR